MESGYVFLIVVGSILGTVALIGILIALLRKITHTKKHVSCFPFKYGGFDDDNGYENWRRK